MSEANIWGAEAGAPGACVLPKGRPAAPAWWRGGLGAASRWLALALVLSGAAQAQGVEPVPEPPPLPGSGVIQVYGSGTMPDTVGAGDLLDVRVFGQAQLSGDFRVAPDGTVAAPFLDPMPAAGRTPLQLQQELTSAYGRWLQHPMVSVRVVEVNSRRIAINGEVPRPGLYAFTGELNLLEALSLAGGLDPVKADSRVYLFHTSAATRVGGGAVPQFRVDTVMETIDTSRIPQHPELNRELQGGDIITVGEAHRVYVVGDVMHPGTEEWRPELTVGQLVSAAGGLLPQADHSHVRVLRLESNGVGRQTLVANFSAIEHNRAPDLKIEPDDIVVVHGTAMRQMGLELLDFFTGTERWRVEQTVANAVP